MTEFVKRVPFDQVCSDLDGRLHWILQDLVMPSQGTLREPGPRGSGRHSPAPWFAPAAELIDTIERGTRRWHERGRAALDAAGHLPPSNDYSLATLPGLVSALADIGSPLGERATASGGLRDGVIEESVRGWWRRARELAGEELPVERLPMVANPDHRSHGGRPRIGPVCARCSHRSCLRILAAGQRSLSWPCPSCGADSLRRDRVTDVVFCLRPSCEDDEGERPSWPLALFEQAAGDPWQDGPA